MQISSTHNPRIKSLLQLEKPAYRKSLGLFVAEGVREIERACMAGYVMVQVFREPSLFPEGEWTLWRSTYAGNAEVYEVSKNVFSRIAYREESGGLVTVFRQGSHQLRDLRLAENPLLLVLEGIEKPGNLGAILRTADAAGIDGIILCDPRIDLYNPNVIRSSIGCLFHVPVAIGGREEVIDWLNGMNISIYTTSLQAATLYHLMDFTQASAIVIGTEDKGVTSAWTQAAHHNIIIPMRGVADSLNLSVSAAIVVFEACRQRGFR